MGWFLLCSSLLFFAVIASSGSLANLPIIAFEDGYTPLFGDHNLAIHRDGKSVHLSLDERTGLFPSFIRFLLHGHFLFFYFCHVFYFCFRFSGLWFQVLGLCLMTFTFMATSVPRLSCLPITQLELWLHFMWVIMGSNAWW